jgi:ketosteroid isomerase-like protein
MKKPRRAAEVIAASMAPRIRISTGEGEIHGLRAASNRAIASGDLAGVAASLAEDFVVVIGDGTLLTREEYLAAFAQGFEQSVPVSYERIADEVRISEALPIGAERGHWVGRLPDGHALFTGTYMAMWRRTEAGWRLRSELFVSLTYAEPG